MSYGNDAGERDRALVQPVARFLEWGASEGPILVLGDPSPSVASLFANAGFDVVRWHRSVAGASTAGAVVSAWPPRSPAFGPGPKESTGTWSTVAVRLSRAKDELEMLLHAAASRLAPGGDLLVYGANDEGIRSAESRIEPLFGAVDTVAVKSRCRVLRAVRPDSGSMPPLKSRLEDWRSTWRLGLPGFQRAWISYPGVFSHGRLDQGTRLLLETVDPLADAAAVLDYGCGSGIIGGVMVERARALGGEGSDLTLLDSDAIALEAARDNVPGVRYVLADGLDELEGGAFDRVVSNPPYHRGKVEDRRVIHDLIEGAARILRRDGALELVVQRRFPVGERLDRSFRITRILGEDGTYRVWRAEGVARGR